MSQAIATQRMSTATVAPAERLELWREVFGSAIARLDIEARGDQPFNAEGQLCALPGAACASVIATPVTVARTPRLIAADPIEMLYLINADAPLLVSQAGKEQLLATGDSIFVRGGEVSTITTNRRCHFINIAVAFEAINQLTATADTLPMRIIARNDPILGLLNDYVSLVCDRKNTMAATGDLSARHITDLIAALATTDPMRQSAPDSTGVKAARLRSIKAEVTSQLCNPHLSVDVVAHRCNISSRYVRRLFQENGSSFSGYVLALRLDRAHRMLAHPDQIPKTIATIAYACGFGDLSYFNRTFRRRFGMTPSDLRG